MQIALSPLALVQIAFANPVWITNRWQGK